MLGRSSEGIYNEENIRPRLFKRWIGKRYPLNIHYPADKYLGNHLHYPLDRDLSIGLGYPAFEQLGPENKVTVLQKKKIPFCITRSPSFLSILSRNQTRDITNPIKIEHHK